LSVAGGPLCADVHQPGDELHSYLILGATIMFYTSMAVSEHLVRIRLCCEEKLELLSEISRSCGSGSLGALQMLYGVCQKACRARGQS
jgi:hypothetical protein